MRRKLGKGGRKEERKRGRGKRRRMIIRGTK
jgi:hypothetical protein